MKDRVQELPLVSAVITIGFLRRTYLYLRTYQILKKEYPKLTKIAIQREKEKATLSNLRA
jgi:hypothetical protein